MLVTRFHKVVNSLQHDCKFLIINFIVYQVSVHFVYIIPFTSLLVEIFVYDPHQILNF